MDTKTPLQDFIDQLGLKMTTIRIKQNPHMNMQSKVWDADHYECTLTRHVPGKGSETLVVYYSQGVGHRDKKHVPGPAPKIISVLDCLASDAAGTDARFEDWAADFGYDTDSRDAFRTYERVQREADKLRAFLGRDAYNQLLSIERL